MNDRCMYNSGSKAVKWCVICGGGMCDAGSCGDEVYKKIYCNAHIPKYKELLNNINKIV